MPGAVQQPLRAIAIILVLGNHAEGHDIADLFERHVAFGHFAPDRIGMLFAARNLDPHAGTCQHFLDFERNGINLRALFAADRGQTPGDRGIGFGFELFKGEQLHLAHVFIHAHTLGQRRVNLHGLARDAAALVLAADEMQRAHIVQAVCQFDEQNAQVLAHRQQELAQVFRCALALAHRFDFGELGHAIDQPRDIGAEQAFDIGNRGQCIFNRIVQQRGDDRVLIELELGHQARHFYGMREIGIAAGALLGAVLLDGKHIGAVQHRLIRIGIISEHAFDKFVLAEHLLHKMGETARSPQAQTRRLRQS